MCLSISRLFWVSSLAYPNLLRTKGYVVVVVVATAHSWNYVIMSDWAHVSCKGWNTETPSFKKL
jgi:hypothetical protein